jgi:hypothetical protein
MGVKVSCEGAICCAIHHTPQHSIKQKCSDQLHRSIQAAAHGEATRLVHEELRSMSLSAVPLLYVSSHLSNAWRRHWTIANFGKCFEDEKMMHVGSTRHEAASREPSEK